MIRFHSAIARLSFGLVGLILMSAALACEDQQKLKPEEPRIAGAWLSLHGMDGYLSARGLGQMDHLRTLGMQWIAYAPEPQMARTDRPEISVTEDFNPDEKIIQTLKAKGFKVMLMPRIESPTFFRAKDPLWRGDIEMTNPADWELFHSQLETMLIAYAKLAQRSGVDLFSLGLEYQKSSLGFPDRWRQMITRIRKHYHGPLTYSGNWDGEYDLVRFWDALDYIGIGAYFPICDEKSAALTELKKGWRERLENLKNFAQSHGKAIIFTEIGYPAFDVAGARPWEWTTKIGKNIDHGHQADCFRAFFDTTRDEEVIAGFFIWRFHTDMRFVKDWEYCPQGRQAEQVIRRNLKALQK